MAFNVDEVFDSTGTCHCVSRHSPPLMVIETHHKLPLSWGGADADLNKTRVCPNTHYGAHALLNQYVHAAGRPAPTVIAMFSKPAQLLAQWAWDHRIPSHPTPFWDHVPTETLIP